MFKAQPAMGFPNKNWKFVFDNPHKTSLIRSTSRIFDLAGLKIISPEGRQFLSLESSFAHVLHPSIISAVQLVEKFCSHVGSSRYVSYPTHFLVGKEFCTEFTDVNCQSITLYGVIVGCVRNKDATFEKGREANTLFIAQYNEDVLEITKSSGTIVQPIQIISAESAWGTMVVFLNVFLFFLFQCIVINHFDSCNYSSTLQVMPLLTNEKLTVHAMSYEKSTKPHLAKLGSRLTCDLKKLSNSLTAHACHSLPFLLEVIVNFVIRSTIVLPLKY